MFHTICWSAVVVVVVAPNRIPSSQGPHLSLLWVFLGCVCVCVLVVLLWGGAGMTTGQLTARLGQDLMQMLQPLNWAISQLLQASQLSIAVTQLVSTHCVFESLDSLDYLFMYGSV